jgi:hypothetical protein
MFGKLTPCLLLAGSLFLNQSADAQQPTSPPAKPASQNSAAPAPSSDRIEQMRTDLNQMESLMNNMSSQINFLRDQNLQILLNTNVRMWTILIRDLRQQLDEQEQRRITEPPSGKPRPPK